MCGIYRVGAVHHSLWLQGVEYLLPFTCIKSECPSHAQAGGWGGEHGGGGSGGAGGSAGGAGGFQMTGA